MDEKTNWDLISNYFNTHGFIENQLESYNHMIRFSLEEIIKNEGSIRTNKYGVEFSEVSIPRPVIIDSDRKKVHITPQQCRERDLTYDTNVYVNIKEIFYEDDNETIKEEKRHCKISLAKIPVMINSQICNLYHKTPKERVVSKECMYDKGGYFIIKGKERVLVSQLRNTYNKIMIFKQKSGDKYSHVAEMRSMSDETYHSVLVQAKITGDKTGIFFSLPYIKSLIPVGIVFKACGYCEEDDIKKLIGLEHPKVDNFYKTIIRDSYFIKNQKDALNYLGQYPTRILKEDEKEDYAWQVIDTEIFPHLGITSSIKQKAYILGSFINKLLSTVIGLRIEDDRDNYKNKRVENAGILCKDLFRTLFKRTKKAIEEQLEKKKFSPDIIAIINRNNNISTGLRYSFATGNWGLQKNSYIRTGVSQVLSRLTYGATLSHMKRLVIPIGKEGKNIKIRQIHPSQIFFVCPVETPEGVSAGIVLNLCLTTKVTKNISKTYVQDVLFKYLEDFTKVDDYEGDNTDTKIYLNGILLGMCEDYDSIVEQVKNLRSEDILDKQVSVSYNLVDNEVNIYCDEGRLIRPVFKLTDNKLVIKGDRTNWDELCENEVIQYLDNSEIQEFVIAMNEEDTKKFHCDYMEISPNLMFGVMGGMIPFADHSQSPRNAYQSNMGKQAIGLFATSYHHRVDTIVNVLDTPQRPLISTKLSKLMGFDEMGSGINAIVAISTYGG